MFPCLDIVTVLNCYEMSNCFSLCFLINPIAQQWQCMDLLCLTSSQGEKVWQRHSHCAKVVHTHPFTHIHQRPCHMSTSNCRVLGDSVELSIHVSNFKTIDTENKRVHYHVQQLSPSQMDYKTSWTASIRMSLNWKIGPKKLFWRPTRDRHL